MLTIAICIFVCKKSNDYSACVYSTLVTTSTYDASVVSLELVSNKRSPVKKC